MLISPPPLLTVTGLTLHSLLLSTILSPFTYILWWNTLGKVLNYESGDTDALAIPIGSIVEFVSLMIIPIFVGMYMAAKFPSMKKLMEQVSCLIFEISTINIWNTPR